MALLLGETPVHKKVQLFHQIQDSIQNLYYEQRIIPVIIVDEIHMAPMSILDDLRLLFNINTCYPLRQRISMRYSIQSLFLICGCPASIKTNGLAESI